MNINEIAAMAGVSRTTVSRALNGGYVSEAARARIQKVIQTTGYIPSAQAKAFRTQKSGLIGILVSALDSELVMRMADELLENLEEYGYQTILMRYLESNSRLILQARQMKSRGVDGLIVFTLDKDARIEKALRDLLLPVVTIGPFGFDSVSGVIHDDYEAFSTLTKAALQQGYDRIGALFPAPTTEISRLRLKAIHDVLAAAHAEDRPAWFLVCEKPGLLHPQCGALLGKRYLQLQDRPTLLIAASDRIAVGAYYELQQAGVRVPQEVALMGAGNTELGRLMSPTLTTVDLNEREITTKATALILEQIDKKEVTNKKDSIKPLLLLRESI